MSKTKSILEAIAIAVGETDIKPYYTVTEMRCRVGHSKYRTEPSGRYQINVSVPGERRDRIFRTKVKDGSFDVMSVADACKDQIRIRLAEQARENARNANKDVAENIRNTYKLNNTYVSSYAGSAGSYVAPSTVEGLVVVQLNFGSISPEKAEAIMAFAKSLEA